MKEKKTLWRNRSLDLKTKHRINTAIMLAALLVAVAVLSRRLHAIRPSELINYLKMLKGGRILLIFLSTGISYAILTGFDWLALRFLRKPIPYPHIARAAFIGYSLGKNLGISWVTGGSMRYRFYLRYGIGLKEVTKLVLFNTTTFLLGFFFWGGISFLIFPFKGGPSDYLPGLTVRLLGLGLLILPSFYLTASWLGWKTLSFRRRKWKVPPFKFALAQFALGLLDVFFTIWILYLLLPPGGISLPSFFGIFFTGELLAILSHAPGGIGIFETAMFEMLKNFFSEELLLSSLLLYRIIYFLLPLTLGVALLTLDEWKLRKRPMVASILHPEKKPR